MAPYSELWKNSNALDVSQEIPAVPSATSLWREERGDISELILEALAVAQEKCIITQLPDTFAKGQLKPLFIGLKGVVPGAARELRGIFSQVLRICATCSFQNRCDCNNSAQFRAAAAEWLNDGIA